MNFQLLCRCWGTWRVRHKDLSYYAAGDPEMKEVVVVKEVYCDEVRVCGGGLEGDEGSFFFQIFASQVKRS